MTDALRAEWTKLRTSPSTAWILLPTVVLTAGLSALVTGTVHTFGQSLGDPTKLSLIGVDLGQAIVAVLGVVVISEEYGTRMIRTTLAAVPRRPMMLAAKATNLIVLCTVASALGVAGSVLAGRLLLSHAGLGNGYTLISLGNGPTVRAAVGSVIYLVLIALLALGIATAIRDTAASIGVVLALLYLVPILAATVQGSWHRHLEQIGPMTAGMSIQSTTGLSSLPISPWAGLGVLAAWSAGALLIGGCALQFRNS
ncbi:MAG: ABC transporter permease [Acidimicrobiales bacterium]|jgi:ABC-2 type transport system permease protein